VDFSKVQDNSRGTVRDRLLDHMNNIGCAGCHRSTDPPGLTLEHFDGLGQLRTMENDTKIDVSAELLSGVKIEGARGLGKYLHDHPKVPVSLVRNIYAYGVGRRIDKRDEAYLAGQARAFAASGYRLPDLMVQVASSSEFYRVVAPGGVQRAQSTPAPATAPSQKSGGGYNELTFQSPLVPAWHAERHGGLRGSSSP
jgi:hypothetical protein